MGKLAATDWQAKWIRADDDISSPSFRKQFKIGRSIARATATICGLGYYELFLNGGKVGDQVLDPGTTYYNHDQEQYDLRARALYATHDVTDYLRTGQNAVGVMLGNGCYSAEDDVDPSPGHRTPYSDRPRMILQLDIEYSDGQKLRIVTDESFKTSSGPITYNDYSHGEIYDARLERLGWASVGYKDSSWSAAQLADAPNGQLRSQMLPPIRVVETIRPVGMHNPAPGVFIYDLGRNISGWCRLRVRGEAGAEVTLRHATWLHKDKTLDNRGSYSPPHIARQEDTYILKGDGEEFFEPRFTLHGFQYVEVTGYPGIPTFEDLSGKFVRTSAPEVGTFTCSNDLINTIHDNVRRSFACCLQSMPQDAIDRSERVAWMGDPGMVAEDIMYNFDTGSFWGKWVDDMRDSQRKNGEMPFVCPIHWRGDFSSYSWLPVWQSNFPIFIWYVYQFYGDERILAENYEELKRFVEFLRENSEEDILHGGLGDHMEPQPGGYSAGAPRNTPATVTSTAYYFFDVTVLATAAKILGKTADADRYGELAEQIATAFNREFLDQETNQYSTGSQTSNAIALQFGLVPEDRISAVVENLVREIVENHDGHLSTGIVGTNALEQALPAHGQSDVMYGISTKTTFPSWGNQAMQGATSLWETWELNPTPYSKNMKMLGSCEEFFYHDLAGIGAASPGFREIIIRPQPVGDLTWAQAKLETVSGDIGSHWERDDESFKLITTIPVNTTAYVHLPKMGWPRIRISSGAEDVWRDGELTDRFNGIASADENDQSVVLKVGSGTYHFYVFPVETP